MKKIILTVSFLLVNVAFLIAQAPPGGGPTGDPIGGAVPIDGGISFLVAAGIAYAGKKFYDKKKENKTEITEE